MSFVTIGVNQDYSVVDPLSPTVNWSLPILEALSHGHRWLLFTDGSYDLRSVIDLDQFTTDRSLILDGAGPHMTNLVQKFTGTPMFLGGAGWDLTFRGMQFIGHYASSTPAPDAVCTFQNFLSADFDNCQWSNGGSFGLRLICQAGAFAAPVRLRNCQFRDSFTGGVEMIGVGEILMIGGAVEGNAVSVVGAGVRITGDGTRDRSYGRLIGVHFEANGAFRQWGLEIDNTRHLRVADSYTWASNFRFINNASDCSIRNCACYDVEIWDYTGNDNDTAGNPNIAMFHPGC